MKTIRLIAYITTLLILSVSNLGIAHASEGGVPQKLCSSKNNESIRPELTIYPKNGSPTQYIPAGQCKTYNKGSVYVKINGFSFRVGYDLKPYQGCQQTPSGYKQFTPSTSPDTIYFWEFFSKNC